jgi:uncharacterized RDD family membrane protein YckC
MEYKNNLYKKHPNSDIVAAPFGRRLLASLVDLLINVLFAFIAFTAIEDIYYKTPAGRAVNTTFFEVKKASTLYLVDDETEYTTDLISWEQKKLGVEGFYLHATYQDKPVFVYENATFYNAFVEFNYEDQVLLVNDESSIYISQDVEKDGITDEERNAFWDKTYKTATANLQRMPVFRKANEPYRNMLFYGSWVAFIIGSLIPYLVLPLILGHGITLGKYLFGLALCNKEGYQVKRYQVLIRYLVYSIVEVGSSLRTFLIPLFITSGIVTLNKLNRAGHDLAAGTYVCDARESKIFVNKEAQIAYNKGDFASETAQKRPYFQLPKKRKLKPKN